MQKINSIKIGATVEDLFDEEDVWWAELVDTVGFLVVLVLVLVPVWWVELVDIVGFLAVLVGGCDELVESSAVAGAMKSRLESQYTCTRILMNQLKMIC